MKNISIWNDINKEIKYNKLDKNIDVDVCVIGGGITGISTIYNLINKNLKICLVEKNTIGSGITSRTTGKLTYLQENIYKKLNNYHGLNKTKLYLNSQIDAINIVKNIISKNNIDCNLTKVDSYVLTTYNKKYINLLKKLGINIKETNTLPDNRKNNKYYYTNDTYVFHPLKYIYELASICTKNNIDIYENTNIYKIEKHKDYYILKTNKFKIKTKYIVIATNYPYFIFPYLMPFKTYIERSYISAYKVKKDYKYSLINDYKPTISLRFHNDKNNIYKILLNNSHNICIKDNIKENFYELLKYKPDYIWSNKDIITIDSLPYIGLIDNNMLIATGYNTWGMTNGSIAGKVISDIILNNKNKYIELFNPKRNINIGTIINFPLILGSNTYSFIKSKLYKNKTWYNNIKFEKRNGKDIAIYIDENKKEHKVYNVCPHLKCSLIFNEIERTWDCPCHGSKFDIDGNVLEGPSNYNIKYPH